MHGDVKRFVFALGAILLSLSLAEVGLRLWYGRLPSLHGLTDEDYERATTLGKGAGTEGLPQLPCSEIRRYDKRSTLPLPKGQTRGLRLALAGDSVVLGVGATKSDKALGPTLKRALQAQFKQPVTLLNLAEDGVGYCLVADQTLQALETHKADAVVAVLFANDLFQYRLFRNNDSAIAFPNLVRTPWLRRAAHTSYLINLVWFSYEAAHTTTRLRSGRSDSSRREFVATLKLLRRRAAELRRPLLLVLLAHSSEPYCAEDYMLSHDLMWMQRTLTQAEIPFLDLSKIWSGQPNHIMPSERGTRQQDCGGVHPDDGGHALIARRLLPAVEAMLKQKVEEPPPRAP